MAGTENPRVALLSIHPEFAAGILTGQKLVEFRRRGFGSPLSHVVVYATAPERRVVGYFTVLGIEAAPPEKLWHRFGGVGLITKKRFVQYFSGLEIGYAIVIGTVVKFSKPRRLQELNGHGLPPQSFSYLEPKKARRILGPVAAHVG